MNFDNSKLYSNWTPDKYATTRDANRTNPHIPNDRKKRFQSNDFLAVNSDFMFLFRMNLTPRIIAPRKNEKGSNRNKKLIQLLLTDVSNKECPRIATDKSFEKIWPIMNAKNETMTISIYPTG